MHLDPYAKALNTPHKWLSMEGDFVIEAKSVQSAPFDWEGVLSPNRPLKHLIIYEMHVRAFTQDPSSGVAHPGTFLGMIEKIPHLVDLGINCVELMPIFEFDERKGPSGLCNFWGYDTVNFFCPMNRYAVSDAIYEFKLLVKALHSAGIEVILDVVYNHSDSFEFDKESYYLLDAEGRHTNYSGCGNTLNANSPKMRALILDSLRYWCTEFHVDGFRFDLAATLTRGGTGTIEAITSDEIIGKKKLIAEPWDPGGLCMQGQFPRPWAEWDGEFRDSIRRHVNFDAPLDKSKLLHPINFVVSHDGFTLNDLVSYNEKHNASNHENNQDGSDNNNSNNYGHEGECASLDAKRQEAMEKMIQILFQAPGTPMIFMGDEYKHTRFGNNNAWCQDNCLNWFDWNATKENQDWLDFFKSVIVRRKEEFTA
ncbi:MAG: hypothetical protein H7A39_05820 [Chlamydiales bacterium]|nr:hypothetical protein [Chlamydiales bacterium]